MLTHMLQSLREEYRTRRMARLSAWILAYGAALALIRFFKGGFSGPLQFLFWIAFTVVVFYYLWRLVGIFGHRLLWRLRRLLIVTYIFIAILPILLILGLVYISAAMVNGQLAAFLVASKLKEHSDELRQLNRVVAHEARLSRYKNPEELLSDMRNLYVT